MHPLTHEATCQFAIQAPELAQIRTLVDLGGAGGAFCIALAQHFPDLRCTILDPPAVRPVAEEFIREFGLSERLFFQAADFFTDPLPPAEAYALSFIPHDGDTDEGSRLLGRIAKASRPGTLLIHSEYLLHEEVDGPRHATRSDLNMLIAARGRKRSAAEYIDWIRAFGFELEHIRWTENFRGFLAARKAG